MTRIDEFFYSVFAPQSLSVSFNSAHILCNKVVQMEQDFGVPIWHRGIATYTITGQQEFFHRDILQCIAYLLKQKAFPSHWAWKSKKVFDYEGVRQYNELYTGDWWAKVEVCTDHYCTTADDIDMFAYL